MCSGPAQVSACAITLTYTRTRLLSLYTFQRGDARKRGSYGEPTPFPYLSLTPSHLLSLFPFYVCVCARALYMWGLSLAPSLSPFLVRSSVVWYAALRVHTGRRIYTHAHRHTRIHMPVPDTRIRYAFLVGCIFQDCGHSYSAPCNMHAVEGADCSARSFRVQRARA